MNKKNTDLIKQIIRNGHKLADELRNCKSVADVEKMSKRVKKYTDLVDENFGVENEYDLEKECELSTLLYIAINWRKKMLYPENVNNPSTKCLADGDLADFEHLLDSKLWTMSSYGIQLG